MAKIELRKAVDSLLNEKGMLDKQMTQLKDRIIVLQEGMQQYRNDENGYREAKLQLGNTASSVPARKVMDRGIAEAHKKFEDVLKEHDEAQKTYEVLNGKIKSLEKSIRDLQNA